MEYYSNKRRFTENSRAKEKRWNLKYKFIYYIVLSNSISQNLFRIFHPTNFIDSDYNLKIKVLAPKHPKNRVIKITLILTSGYSRVWVSPLNGIFTTIFTCLVDQNDASMKLITKNESQKQGEQTHLNFRCRHWPE